ncbi:MAG TPA: sialidase family protein [Candidatus Hydrogenedentes bacterium]|nr:sialidase family protein [Candidatus Hydrogenedentota bacterium]
MYKNAGFIPVFLVMCCCSQFLFAQDLVKEKDIIIYQDDHFYSAFPSVVLRPDGELVVAFRRAPERRYLGEPRSNHTDPNSYLVLVRSKDNGESWTAEPELIFAHPFGGSQDPCMTQLRDGAIVCSSYGWALLRGDAAEKVPPTLRHGDFVFMGGYLVRSLDGGHSWTGPVIPPSVPGNEAKNVFREPCPAYNRGPMWEGRDGSLYWAVASQSRLEPRLTEVHLMASKDAGLSWEYRCPVARDSKVTFNETALIETRGGALVAFLRTADFDDHTAVARSTDGGNTFGPWEDAGFQGHPHCATLLPDGRILLVYGYRHALFGIRARILDADAANIAGSEEIILREDGGNSDLGYPWVTPMADGRYLVVYYFNQNDGVRHIAGTILKPR